MKFAKDFLRDFDGETIEDKITEKSRWSLYHRRIFKHDGKLYETYYSVGATEQQDESPYEDEPDEIEVRFDVRTVRTPFHLVKSVSLRCNEAVLRIHERVTNESGQEVSFTWGHNPALGWPFVDESCRVDLPACRIRTITDFTPSTSRLKPDQISDWPLAEGIDGGRVDLSRIPGPEATSSDMVFLEGITEGWYAVTNTRIRLGFALRYPADLFKQLWFWQVYRGGQDYPWWSATYNVALEPCATLPVLSHAAARGEALTLGAGESRELDLMAIAFEGIARVSSVTSDGSVHS